VTTSAEARARRYRDLVVQFTELDISKEDFFYRYGLIKRAAQLALNGPPVGKHMQVARDYAIAARRKEAQEATARIMPAIRALQKEGVVGYRQMATELNKRGVKPRKSNKWSHTMVRDFMLKSARL